MSTEGVGDGIKGFGYFPSLQAGSTAVSAAECAGQRFLLFLFLFLSLFFPFFPSFAALHGAEGAGFFLVPWLLMVKTLL